MNELKFCGDRIVQNRFRYNGQGFKKYLLQENLILIALC